MPSKTKHWDSRVFQWATSRLTESFEWGETDCGSLVRKVCGIVYLADVFPNVPEYSSLREAKEVWDEVGGISQALQDIGAEEYNINFLQGCDIVITEEDEFDFHAAMIYVRSGFLASSVDYGVQLLRHQDLPDDCYALRLPNEVE